MSDIRPIRVIVQTFTASRDINGNCYHYAIFTNPAKGLHASIAVHVGGQSNARHLAYRLAGNDWEGTFTVGSTIGKREWKHARKDANILGYEYDQNVKQALAELFDVPLASLERN